MSESIDRAKRMLQGESAPAVELLRLARQLKGEQKFDLARRILGQASRQPIPDPDLRRTIQQQEASCTEKDPDLPQNRRHELALEILGPALQEAEAFLLQPPFAPLDERRRIIRAHQETFGIAGAIHKRWWMADAQMHHLVEAQQLYEKGWRLAVADSGPGIPDQGYTGINAAFVLDLLAEQVPENPQLAAERRTAARQIREEIRRRLSALPPAERGDWWTLVTLAEACFGSGDYPAAREWLVQARAVPSVQPWEFETTARQLARLARIHAGGGDRTAAGLVRSQADQVLREFLGGDEAALATVFNGRVGLALSGGGFRASLFHIGVLARLAELDMLRHVEVLSCVSGGSIIGAHYYLLLRTLLESKPDTKITPQDYIDLVARLEQDFTAAIQDNPRMKVFSQVTRLGGRTEAMGELLDQTIYGPASGCASGQRPELRQLRIQPAREGATPADPPREFSLKHENWRRAHKVPILIINATTLNTGHNWQFTAAFMGESPHHVVPEVDANERLRRMYFSEPMPAEHQSLPLGRAVAASAAVPALFRPIRLAALYPERDVELVDGGVQDNQGIAGLLEQDCTVLLVSDASGQFVTQFHPDRSEIAVLLRSNEALMARVRELEYRELAVRREAGLIRGFLFLHLKKDLTVDPVDWIGCDLHKESGDQVGVRPDSSETTSYGIRGDLQNLLAGLRTDLDAFCEVEAAALMTSGYRMTLEYFPRSITGFAEGPKASNNWPFLKVQAFLADQTPQSGPGHSLFARWHDLLALGGKLLFKGVTLSPIGDRIKAIVVAFGLILAGPPVLFILAGLVRLPWEVGILLIPALLWLVIVGGIGALLARGALYRMARYFDRYYLKDGSLPPEWPAEGPASGS